jgi:DNA-binding transcriptional LysR family regulator
MEFNDLTYYGVLAQELNFHRAAARLGINQPSLTRRIRRLEREIGAYLLERHSGGISLTAAGEIFAERAASIADEIARLMTEIADAGRGVLGRLAERIAQEDRR